MKSFFLRLGRLSPQDWVRVIWPWLAAAVLTSVFVSILEKDDGLVFSWPVAVEWFQGAVMGSLWLVAVTIVLVFVCRIQVGQSLREHWLVWLVWWGIVTTAFAIAETITITFETHQTERLAELLANGRLFTNMMIVIGVKNLFVIVFLEGFWQITGYFRTLSDVFGDSHPSASSAIADHARDATPKASESADPIAAARVPAEPDGELRTSEIPIDAVSYVDIKDGFRTVVFKEGGGWKRWGSYRSLKEFQDEFPTQLMKINRSVLINPHHVSSIDKKGRHYLIQMAGSDEAMQVSRSMTKTIQNRFFSQRFRLENFTFTHKSPKAVLGVEDTRQK